MDPSLPTNQGGEKVQELEQKLAEMRQQAQPQEPASMATQQPPPPSYPATPVVEPTSPPPTLPKSPSTSLPVLIILFFLVALATIGYYLASMGIVNIPGISPTPAPVSTPTPSPDPMADWKTYTNTKYGFEFKYPQQWAIKSEAVSGNREVSFDTKINTGLQTPETQTKEFFVMYHKNVTDLTKWLTDNQAGKVVEVKTIGSNQFSVIEGGAILKDREYAVKLAGNNLLRFVVEPMSTNLEDIKQTDQLFDQILSTFKVTNQRLTIDMSNWKTYTNTNGGYQYSYPPSWKSTEPCQSLTGPECGDGPQNSSSVADPNFQYPYGQLFVTYYDKDFCASEDNVVKSYTWKNLIEKQITIDGENAKLLQGKLNYTNGLYLDHHNILVVHGNSCFQITTWSDNNQNQEEVFNAILSTFKFTN